MAALEARAATQPMRAALVPPLRLRTTPAHGPCNPSSASHRAPPPPPPAAATAPPPARRPRPLAPPSAAAPTTNPLSASTDPILVSAVSNRDTIASLLADRLAGPQGEAHVWATGAAAQFVAVGALAEAQPLLKRLSPGHRLEAAARWASGTDFEPDEQKRRLRKLEVWARAVPVEGEGQEAAAPPAAGPRLSADRTRERDELVAAIARQLGTVAAPPARPAAASPPSLASLAAAALAPPPPAAAAAKKKRGRPPKTAPKPAEPEPEQPAPAEPEASYSASGVAEIEARGEQAVMRALKAVLFLQQQQQQGAAAAAASAEAAAPSSSSSSPLVLVLAPRIDMVADTAAERRGEPAREVPGIVLEVRAVGGGGGGGSGGGGGGDNAR